MLHIQQGTVQIWDVGFGREREKVLLANELNVCNQFRRSFHLAISPFNILLT
jgi:hypothetical protein